ncbi:endonuclease [Aeribacillus sp. FSL K6-2848]|uniref:endonuclease n=1 Tax=Aeribacillus TaxID=1055323 RepID=UPI0028729208|nr:endonuclease [Aeribacillus pallidus]MED0715207.1 endonuclease [Aeribacillus composti]
MSSQNNFLSRLCGKLLGDGCLTKQEGRKPRFQFVHNIHDKQWAWHCFQSLKEYIPLNEPKYKFVKDKRIKRGFTECYIVQSKTAEKITELEKIWYKNRIKRIPFPFLHMYLNEEALAWWYQDDGYLKTENHIPRKIVLSTDNFRNEENKQLIKLLEYKFSLVFSLDKQNRLVLYDQAQIIYFQQLINPYLHQSMNRKILQIPIIYKHNGAKRTTIYLTENIDLKRPTDEINKQLNLLPQLYKIIETREGYLSFYRQHVHIFLENAPQKPYQIRIESRHWKYLQLVKSKTGWNISTIIFLCFSISN